MIGAAFALPVLSATAAGQTITPGYSYRRRFVIPQSAHRLTTADGSVVLPVLITAPWLKSAANGGKVQSSSGHDIRFESDTGAKLPHDPAGYDPSTGRLEAWLRLLPPGPDVPLAFALVYGNPAQVTAEGNPTAVWQGFIASWDMASGLDAGPQAAHLELVDMPATTLLGMDAASLTSIAG